MRNVILHYHIFKNAGTSVDSILQANFPDQWATREFDRIQNSAAVAEWIASNPAMTVFSSHSCQFPIPAVGGTNVIPVMFLRHPLDRIRSSYIFARTQNFDAPHVKLARATTLAEYIRKRLDDPSDKQCRNAQTTRLARFTAGNRDSELDRALSAVIALPVVGLVEAFEKSIAHMEKYLKEYFPDFRCFMARKNVMTSVEKSLDEKLGVLRSEIGDGLYEELLDANLKDICLHAAAQARLTCRSGAVQEITTPDRTAARAY
jgi:hypothetical protein